MRIRSSSAKIPIDFAPASRESWYQKSRPIVNLPLNKIPQMTNNDWGKTSLSYVPWVT